MIKYTTNAGMLATNLEAEPLSFELLDIDDVEKLPTEGCSYVVIDVSNSNFIPQLKRLRQRTHYTLLPVFYLGILNHHQASWFDGPFDSQAPLIAKNIHERMRHLVPHNNETGHDVELLLVRYLYVRGNSILKGQLNHHSVFGLQYPLLNILDPQQELVNSWQFLQEMVAKGLLKQGPVVDELQTCPHCESGLLNFKNACPACHSIRINKESFVHCFSCGNIGPQSEFLKHEHLICNRCQTSLRHVGIDYDKPIEDKRCIDCHHDFFELHVNAFCMVCTKLSDPGDLETKKVYDYYLDSQGELLAKKKEIKHGHAFNEFNKHVDLDLFMTTVNWQIRLARRHTNIHFSMISLIIKNKQELVVSHGIVNTDNMLVKFYEDVLLLLREGDLVTQDKNSLFFFLPMTHVEGYRAVIERIKTFANQPGAKQIEIGFGIMLSNEIIDDNIDMKMLFDKLHSREKEYV